VFPLSRTTSAINPPLQEEGVRRTGIMKMKDIAAAIETEKERKIESATEIETAIVIRTESAAKKKKEKEIAIMKKSANVTARDLLIVIAEVRGIEKEIGIGIETIVSIEKDLEKEEEIVKGIEIAIEEEKKKG
jgi:hypothetical protein